MKKIVMMGLAFSTLSFGTASAQSSGTCGGFWWGQICGAVVNYVAKEYIEYAKEVGSQYDSTCKGGTWVQGPTMNSMVCKK